MIVIDSIDYDLEKVVDDAVEELTTMVSSVAGHISEYGDKAISREEIGSDEILDSLMIGLSALTRVSKSISHLQTYPDSLDRMIKLDRNR
ncbi:MAG: hypothetical protein GY788_07530 [bacterium]|nr:hypothetical protein [bacterium]